MSRDLPNYNIIKTQRNVLKTLEDVQPFLEFAREILKAWNKKVTVISVIIVIVVTFKGLLKGTRRLRNKRTINPIYFQNSSMWKSKLQAYCIQS